MRKAKSRKTLYKWLKQLKPTTGEFSIKPELPSLEMMLVARKFDISPLAVERFVAWYHQSDSLKASFKAFDENVLYFRAKKCTQQFWPEVYLAYEEWIKLK